MKFKDEACIEGHQEPYPVWLLGNKSLAKDVYFLFLIQTSFFTRDFNAKVLIVGLH